MYRREAEERLSDVSRVLARATGFRGFKPALLAIIASISAATGVVAQIVFDGDTTATTVAVLWIAVAVVVATGAAVWAVLPGLRSEHGYVRRAAAGVVVQFTPAILVGAGATAIMMGTTGAVSYLPAVWSSLYGVAIVSVSPYVPHSAGAASLWYLAAAAVLTLLPPDSAVALNQTVAATFTVGHALTAILLAPRKHPNEARTTDGHG